MGGYLFSLVLTLHIIVGISVIVFVLLQHGKGADVGASFGGGASGSLFGATGASSFLSRTTAILATVFFITSLTLTYLASNRPAASGSVMESVSADQSAPAAVQSAPAADRSKSSEIPK